MSDKAFIDTNVLLYAIDRSAGAKQRKARALLKELARQGHGIISTQIIEEAYNGATRKLGVAAPKARRWVEHLENFEVVILTVTLIKQAIDCSILNQLSFWDGLIIVAAEAANCQVIYTEDLNTGQVIRGVKVVNPF